MRTRTALAIALLILGSRAQATTYTWTAGGGADTSWSNAANWGGDGPQNGEADVGLVFPALLGHYASNNDLTGLGVSSIGVTTQLSDGAYSFTGNQIALGGPVAMSSPGSGNPNLVWEIPVALAGDVTIGTSGRQTQWKAAIGLANHTLTLDVGGDLVLSGIISGSGNLVKNNTSALTVTAANTYTGSTTGNGGAFYISNAAALGASGTGTTFNGGFLGFSGNTFTTSEPFVFNGGEILAYGTPTMTGAVTLDATIDIQPFEAASILTMSGAIGGGGGIVKVGPGLLVLNAPSESYGGATAIAAGTLRLDTALSSVAPIAVASGVLEGNGSGSGTISVANGGTIAPGESPGQLSAARLSMVSGATFAAEIDGPNAVADYDRIALNGPVSLGGATLAVDLGFVPADGQQFTLIAQQGGDAVNGAFDGLAEGATFQAGGTKFGITYRGGAGGDVVLIANPVETATPTATVPAPPSATPSRSPTLGGATATPTPTPTTALGSTPTATVVVAGCAGDCNGNGWVTLDELVLGVSLVTASPDDPQAASCPPLDVDDNGQVTVAELILAVRNALGGCPNGG